MMEKSARKNVQLEPQFGGSTTMPKRKLFSSIITFLQLLIASIGKSRSSKRGNKRGGKALSASATERATPKQLGMARAICGKLGLNFRTTCRQEMQCWPDQLTKRTASDFITKLKEMESGDGEQPARRNDEAQHDAPSGDAATSKQKGMIKAICRNLSLNPFDYVRQATGRDIDDITKRDASTVIEALKSMEEEATAVA
jgi:hypothetical protein